MIFRKKRFPEDFYKVFPKSGRLLDLLRGEHGPKILKGFLSKEFKDIFNEYQSVQGHINGDIFEYMKDDENKRKIASFLKEIENFINERYSILKKVSKDKLPEDYSSLHLVSYIVSRLGEKLEEKILQTQETSVWIGLFNVVRSYFSLLFHEIFPSQEPDDEQFKRELLDKINDNQKKRIIEGLLDGRGSQGGLFGGIFYGESVIMSYLKSYYGMLEILGGKGREDRYREIANLLEKLLPSQIQDQERVKGPYRELLRFVLENFLAVSPIRSCINFLKYFFLNVEDESILEENLEVLMERTSGIIARCFLELFDRILRYYYEPLAAYRMVYEIIASNLQVDENEKKFLELILQNSFIFGGKIVTLKERYIEIGELLERFLKNVRMDKKYPSFMRMLLYLMENINRGMGSPFVEFYEKSTIIFQKIDRIIMNIAQNNLLGGGRFEKIGENNIDIFRESLRNLSEALSKFCHLHIQSTSQLVGYISVGQISILYSEEETKQTPLQINIDYGRGRIDFPELRFIPEKVDGIHVTGISFRLSIIERFLEIFKRYISETMFEEGESVVKRLFDQRINIDIRSPYTTLEKLLGYFLSDLSGFDEFDENFFLKISKTCKLFSTAAGILRGR